MLLFGNLAAILVLWSIIAHAAIQVGQFHSDCAPPAVDGYMSALQRAALLRTRAYTERRGLDEDQLGEPRLVFRTANHREQCSRAVLLHLYWRAIDVESAFV